MSLFNKVWLFTQRKNAREFHRHAEKCEQFQTRILLDNLSRNAETVYGKRFGFGHIKNYQEYKDRVPVLDNYLELKPHIQSMIEGENNVLFNGIPNFFETTSGSTSEPKYIPYNKVLKEEFNKAISVWMHDLYKMNPLIFKRKAYWSLSPPLKDRWVTNSGIPVGTLDDSEYFNSISAFLLKQIFAVDPGTASISDPHEFYIETWRQLISQRDLTFISVWSPQFLIRLMEFFSENSTEILKGVSSFRLNQVTSSNMITIRDLFPSIQLISCWTQGQSVVWKNKLHELAGGVPVQGKGLLSTEGVTTTPLGMNMHILSYTSHFYEFMDQDGYCFTAEELELEKPYEVILSTGGGLYRYNTHDLVQCTGYYKSIPALEFIGRNGSISDLVGEKVSENSIAVLFSEILEDFPGILAMYLHAKKYNGNAGYVLLIESINSSDLELITTRVEHELLKNPYYQQAVRIGQLKKLNFHRVDPGFTNRLTKVYQSINGIKDGDLKLPVLFLDDVMIKVAYSQDK